MNEDNKASQPTEVPAETPTTATTQPAPAATATPTPTAQPVVAGAPKKNKTTLLVGIIVAALVVAGAVAYGVYAYVTNTPDYLLTKSIEQLGKEDALAAKFKFSGGNDGASFTFSGDIAARADKANKAGEVVIGLGAGDSRVAISARVFEDTTFLRFGSLDHLGNLVKSFAPDQAAAYNSPEFKQALSRVDSKWFSLTKEEIAALSQSTTQKSTVNGIKPEDLQRLADIYNKHPFFKADKTYADETVDNIKTGHFNVKMDKQTYKAFLQEVKAANLSTVTVTDSDINNSDKDADDFAANTSVEFWVARDSKKMKQVKFANLQKGNEGSLMLTFETNLPQFEKLEKPTGAQPFSEFMTTLLGPSFSAQTSGSLDETDLMAQ